jgi:uncharacterized protein YecT (DUF1311 family)
MKFFKIQAGLILLLFSFQCQAQVKNTNPIDVDYQHCLAKDTSTVNICNCAFVAYGKWNKEMDNSYKKLLKTLKKENEKAVLKQSQTAWLAYRDAEFKSHDYIFNIPGNKWCSLRQDGRIDIVKARVMQLQDYLTALKAK